MKTLSVALFTCIMYLTLIYASNPLSLPREDVNKSLFEYKQKYAIGCGTIYNSPDFDDDISFPLLEEWRRITIPFTPEAEQYNTLWIPDTLGGTSFTLRIHDTIKQYFSGAPTSTIAFNNSSVLGPTLIFKKGTTVQMHVKNDLSDTTTVHWHGIHLPALMDGGPHQPVIPGTTWNPSWIITNNAAAYWYHPHLHMKTTEHLIKGLAGMIIIKDSAEEALKLPRTYGVDDIPLVLNDKRFESNTNQLIVSHYGDTMMCNGTLKAQYNIPGQVVRFRILNAVTERSYNIGFSDNRKFSVIAGDAGLLDKPAEVKRYILSPGERIEILVNFAGQENQNVTLRAFNSNLPNDIPGSEPNTLSTPKELRNKLGRRDFDILRLNVITQTTNPVTTIPSSLIVNNSLDSNIATVTRTINMTDAGNNCSIPSFGCFLFNGQFYDMNRIDYQVKKDATEIWQITNNTNISHPFHIHDVSFKILSKTDTALAEYEKGWKDVVLVRKGSTVRFIAKFADYADSIHPYMYHCHISMHEDAGMMGQFVVVPLPSINITNAKMKEGNSGTKQMNFNVSLSNASVDVVRVNYKTKDITAIAPTDYIASNSTVTFNPGETLKTISITINGDTSAETNETFKVILSQPQNTVLSNSVGKGTIKNDDSVALVAKNNAASVIYSKTKIETFPNPLFKSTNISFTLLESQKVAVNIFNMNGIRVKTIANIQMQAGTHQLVWNARDEKGNAVIPGIYFLRFETENYSETTKLIVVN